jgi:hypothetical protein
MHNYSHEWDLSKWVDPTHVSGLYTICCTNINLLCIMHGIHIKMYWPYTQLMYK